MNFDNRLLQKINFSNRWKKKKSPISSNYHEKKHEFGQRAAEKVPILSKDLEKNPEFQ